MAVTRAGVPVRCWTFPGDASDQLIIRRIHDDLAGWRLNRVLWVPDRGFPSGADRAYLQRGGRSCVLAERLRAPRFVVVHNPEAEERDRRVRENLCAYLEEQIAGSDSWPQRRRDELVGRLRTTPGLFPLLRRTRQGLLRLDRAAASREARLVGKWLLRTSDETFTAEDSRSPTSGSTRSSALAGDEGRSAAPCLPPPRGPRSSARTTLLALTALIRVVENATGETWRCMRELKRMHLVTLESGRAGSRGAHGPPPVSAASSRPWSCPDRFS